jgi:hypothetical protein
VIWNGFVGWVWMDCCLVGALDGYMLVIADYGFVGHGFV